MSLCDICNTPVEGTKVSAAVMRAAVAKGFTPFTSVQFLANMAQWRAMVQANETAWNVCPGCFAKLQPYLDSAAKTPQPLPDVPGATVLRGHEERVSDVAIFPDSKRVLTCSWDSTLRIWDFATGKQLSCLRDHKDFVEVIALHPNGKIAASGGADRVIRIWDLEQGTVLRRLKGHSYTIFSLKFSPDGSQLVSGSGDKTVQLWDVHKGERIRKFGSFFGAKHESGVECVTFSPDRHRILSVGLNAILWDTASGKSVIAVKETPLYQGVFLDNTHFLISGSGGFSIHGINTGSIGEKLEGFGSNTSRFCVSKGGILLVGKQDDLFVYDLNSRKVLKKLRGHQQPIMSAAVSNEGRCAVTGSFDRTARTWLL